MESSSSQRKTTCCIPKNLSKAFDWLLHELLFANLHAYDFSISVLRLIYSYATNRKQRTKIHSIYSSWKEILFEVPQGFILGLLIINIFLCDIFLIMKGTELASYADANTSYTKCSTLEDVTETVRLF